MVKRNDFTLNTIVGPGTSVFGDIDSAGFTRVDGAVHGDVKAKGKVIVGEEARLKSNISGTAVTIGGVVYGNIIASDRIIVLGTGLVLGDIITRRIRADDGCLIHGKIVVCKSDEQWEKLIVEYKDKLLFQGALSDLSSSHG